MFQPKPVCYELPSTLAEYDDRDFPIEQMLLVANVSIRAAMNGLLSSSSLRDIGPAVILRQATARMASKRSNLPTVRIQLVKFRVTKSSQFPSENYDVAVARRWLRTSTRPTDRVLSLYCSAHHDLIAVISCAGRTMPLALPILLLLISHSQQITVADRAEFKAALDAPVKSASVSGAILLPTGRVESVIVTVARAISPPREYSDGRWREMAGRVNAAFLFLSLQQPPGENIPVGDQVVRNAAAGGADGLVALLNRFAAESGHDELRTVPLLFFGGSAGGSFGTTFAMLHPSRTIGLVRYNSHSRGLTIDVEKIRTIPALLLAAGDDQVAGTEDAEKLWRQGRALQAPWTFGIQPGQGHLAGLEQATPFILSWIEGVMHHRLASGKLREIDSANSWRADNRTSRIDRGRALPADLPHTSWLPDEKTAKLWQQVVGEK